MVRTEKHITVPEAARWLAVPGERVYELVFAGTLEAERDEDGAVYVSVSSIDRYLSAPRDE